MKPSKANVLLVEDNLAEARLAQEALHEALGEAHTEAELHVTSDGVQAMEFLRREGMYQNAPRPQLVLLDLNLPRKDGREVLSELKADLDLRSIPVVILTTSRAQSDIHGAYESYANCYIEKPLELEGFITVMKSIQRFWLQTAELPA